MIGYTTEFVLARHPGLFRLYRSDMSWQTVGRGAVVGVGWTAWLCADDGRNKGNKMKQKTKQEKCGDTCMPT